MWYSSMGANDEKQKKERKTPGKMLMGIKSEYDEWKNGGNF